MKELSLGKKIAYGIGAVGKDMVYMLSASYILYYYQDIIGVSAWIMGVILLIARVFDAFNDPLMGVIVAKTKTRWGKFRPWLLIGTLTNAVVLFLMFSCPPSLDSGGLVAYAAIFYILWGVTYTMMDIPYWSMIPALTKGGKERENLSALARTCAGVGSAIITVITVIAVSVLGNFAVSHSANTAKLELSAGDKVTAYVVEMDEAGAATGNVLTLDKNVTAALTCQSSELEKQLSYNDGTTDFTVKVGGLELTKDNCTMDFTMDDAKSGTATLAVYVDSASFEKVKTADSLSLEMSSTKEVERYGFKYFSLIVAVIFVVFIVITCIMMKEKSTVNMESAGIKDMFRSLIHNDQAMTVVITIVLVNIATYITSNLLIYFFKYDLAGANWQGNYTLFNTFAGAVQILAMMIFFPILRKFFSTKKLFNVVIFASIGGYIVLLIMALAGVNSVYPFLVPGFFIMAAVGILNVLVTIFLANTVDYGELKNGRREESVIFSMQTFVVKLASGVAALVASLGLQIFNISESSGTIEAVDGSVIKGLEQAISAIKSSGAAVVSNSSVVGIRLIMTLLPIFGLIVALLLFNKKYILTDERIVEISNELAERKKA